MLNLTIIIKKNVYGYVGKQLGKGDNFLKKTTTRHERKLKQTIEAFKK